MAGVTKRTNEQIVDFLHYIIGLKYSQALLHEVQETTGRTVRVGHYGTTDYQAERINLKLDDEQVIRGLTFG